MRALLACALLAVVAALTAAPAQAQGPAAKVLVYPGPASPVNDAGVAAIQDIADDASNPAADFEVEVATDAATAFTAENLADVDAVVFLNSSGDRLNAAQEAAFEDFVTAGGGFVGIGASAEAEPNAAFFNGLIGARPAASSPTGTTEQTVVTGDRAHPSTRDLPLMLNRSDVWYQWQTRPTGSVHTVARYHAPNAPAGDGTSVGGTDHPISWCRDYQGGRSFYTGMGRTAASYDADLKKHLLGGVQWAAGIVRADCKATINANYEAERLVAAGPENTGLATSGESHGLTIAPNGWVMYIGRADCRTDAARGALLGGNPFGRILDHSDPRVGLGCGSIHIWDPEAANGTLNSGVSLAGTLAVYGDGGQDGERTDENDHKLEWGLLGIAAAPDFDETGHIYVQYFPSYHPASKPAGLPESYRIRKMSKPRISRFTINLETKKLNLDSEVKIFEYDAQIYSCCHVGGGMGFDSAGNLYVTTGDTNSSQGTGGYSGNNPAAKCPTGPANQASSAHCGDNPISYQDARRTAGNTNDYNGKMLRFKPIPSLADGSQLPPGPGSTYTLPTADDPNGANLFKGDERRPGDPAGTVRAKPEIYAMGLRNPSRLSIDPETDIPYTAWVGPDAGSPSVTSGPSTYENAAQISVAGNYGWPYCMGNQQAYRDRVMNQAGTGSQLRTTNGPGYVSGGPATGGTDGWYDCNNIHNDSPNNTGLQELPHQTGTLKDAGKTRKTNLWFSRGNPDNDGNPQTNTHNGCPDFPRDRGAANAPNYGAVPTQLCPYVTSDGLTIMNGPVYRYDEDAQDDSRRWPAYWDGRWFVHNSGGPSVKHGLLLDPATDEDGGQPIYADSLRDTLSWSGSYMDSKFGPDGALYVQTYDGFFRAGPNAGIYRYDYTGGGPTPGANPKGVAIGDFQVEFSSGGSGGVSYEWAFGDGETSTEANPTHTYDEAREYTATLTVTYADGGKDSKTVTVNVLAEPDTTAPVTTHTLDPAVPNEPNGTYSRPVTVTLNATDAAGGSGVEKTEYSINNGPWQTYTGPFTRSQPGQYVVEYRSTDRTGNVEDPAPTVNFTITVVQNCPTNLNDEFDGTTLDPKWTILRGDPALRSVGNGFLDLKIATGTDMFGDQATAKNVLLQDAPNGSWVVTTKLDVSQLADSGQQAGLVLWQAEDPNTFAKIVYIEKGASRQFEYVATREDSPDIRVGPTFGTDPGEVYLRVSANGSGTYVAEGSFDGETWQAINGPIENLGDPDTIKLGLKVSDGSGPANIPARYDYFRVDCSDKVAPVTTAEVSPEQPDGELGWYTEAPTVELTADDGDLGSVAKIEYRVDGGATRLYEGPFTVGEPGEHTVEYFATDGADEPNVEAPKSLRFRVDSLAPVTAASVVPGAGENAPVQVTLQPSDGDKGSGAVMTQYRVDGGPWKTYSAKDEDVLFDGTEESLAWWQQAGGGQFHVMDDGSGGITPTGGFGMLWYPQAQFGDFRFKFEFREGRPSTDDNHSNGGAFVRFPDPRTPLAEREDECAKTGNAATAQDWVAIYCGHEIQLYDGPTGEVQKTGSIYNFQPNDIDEIGTPKPRGQWNEYEIEVIGQHYKITRNGTVINEFDNAPGQESSRGGDPSTTLRQFEQGFIGLQNHGDPDQMQYRNMRVEQLDDDRSSAGQTGAFTVAGVGPHTVEFRSWDAAGNVEATRTEAFEIGRVTPPGSTGGSGTTPPVGILPPMIDTPATYKLGSVVSRIASKRFAKRGISVPVSCTGAMSGSAKLTVSKSTARKLKLGTTTLDASDVRCYGEHTAKVSLKPSKALARKLARWRKSSKGPRSVKLRLAVQMLDWGKPAQTTSATIRLRKK